MSKKTSILTANKLLEHRFLLREESVQQPTQKNNKANIPTLNLNDDNQFKLYVEICQKFINSRRNNFLNITGDMLANAAKNTFNKYKSYVPPELSLAQLAAEGGFSSNPNSRPIRTKNPYNVGNVDTGKNVYHNDVKSGIQKYYDLVGQNYLSNGKDINNLLSNFVNKSGRRYASSQQYEQLLRKLVRTVRKISEPIYLRLRSNV